MKLPTTFEALVDQADKLHLYKNLVRQLNKDCLLANIDQDFDEDFAPSDLIVSLQEIVYHLIQEKFTEYLNFLYIVDVAEEKIKQLDGSEVLNLLEQVAFLILLREWQKVWYRNYY